MDLANHGLILLQQLNAQREFGFLCDCTVAIGDVFFKAHKAVLAAFSNYFRMLFIHQDSDCVRLKAADIQPDIFSYLLNLMYTGKLAPQLIDPARLEQGVKFLHAYPLLQEASLPSQSVYSHGDPSLPLLSTSSLYGIQISDQQRAAPSPRPPARRQISPPVEVEKKPDARSTSASAAAYTTSSKLTPPLEAEASAGGHQSQFEEPIADTLPGEGPSSVNAILNVKPSIMKRSASFRKHYSCHLCRTRFNQRSLLREHLLQHAHAMLPHSEPCAAPPSPAAPRGSTPASLLEVDEIMRASGGVAAQLAAAMSVDMVSDCEQAPPPGHNMDSPRAEVTGWGTGATLSQADTPPPSDIADIDNLEGGDLDREVKRRKYECSTCGRKFIQKSHWREHMYIHTGKPYKCSACGKSFCRANQAARHVCLNGGADAYTMVDRQSMELCAAGDDSSQLEALFMGSARPYKCNMCETTFSSPNEVIKHLCFSQGVLAGLQGQTGTDLLPGTQDFSKDEGSDSSGAGPALAGIKTEEILVE
ncbi:zinc finger and BTB domain-containing protein 2b [Aplochiton taeniatus]